MSKRKLESWKIWQATCSLNPMSWDMSFQGMGHSHLETYILWIYPAMQTHQDMIWYALLDSLAWLFFEMCPAQDVSPCSFCCWVVWTWMVLSSLNYMSLSSRLFHLCAPSVLSLWWLSFWRSDPMKKKHMKKAWQVGNLLIHFDVFLGVLELTRSKGCSQM